MPTANCSSAADAPQPGTLRNDASAAADATLQPGTLKDDADGTQKNDADETCDPDAVLSPDRVASSPLPGVVLLKNALDDAGQREVLEWALRHGIDRKAWLDADGALNAPRQFRGRCYDAVEAVDRRAGALSDALQDAARKAYEDVDPVGASTTHLLMLFYANLARGPAATLPNIFWAIDATNEGLPRLHLRGGNPPLLRLAGSCAISLKMQHAVQAEQAVKHSE